MSWLLAGFALLIIILLIARWLATAKPADVYGFLRISTLIVLVALTAALLWSGRLMWLLWMLPAWMFWLLRFLVAAQGLRHFWRQWRNATVVQGMGPDGGAPTGQFSEVETRFFQMRLDHDSGEMDGMVREGPHAGRRLSEMPLEALLDLRTECLQDDDSLRLLDSFLDRVHGEDWHAASAESADHRAPDISTAMDEAAAWKVLDLDPGASAAEIKAAHRRLMGRLHPDHGGSSYLAAQINQAREILLARAGEDS